MNKYYFLVIVFQLTIIIYAQDFELWSTSAIMIDYQTEQILYQKNEKSIVQPASMTKLINLYMAYNAIKSGRVSMNDFVPISSNADWRNLPRDSSLMFIEEGQKVTLKELMIGLAIPSGNDAAIAIAEYLFGTVDNYLLEVTFTLKNMGFKNMKFVDSSGFDDFNEITVEEFVEFCLIFIKKYPESLEDLFTLPDFTYPTSKNGKTSIGTIKQYNHNSLIGIFPGCDGLKTGFINKSGMNISLTAHNNDRRVVAVLVGVKDLDKKNAKLKRINDSVSILNFGLSEYENIRLSNIKLPKIKVINSPTKSITPEIPYNRLFSSLKNKTYTYDFNNITAPISAGKIIGNVKFTQGNIEYKFPVLSKQDIYSF